MYRSPSSNKLYFKNGSKQMDEKLFFYWLTNQTNTELSFEYSMPSFDVPELGITELSDFVNKSCLLIIQDLENTQLNRFYRNERCFSPSGALESNRTRLRINLQNIKDSLRIDILMCLGTYILKQEKSTKYDLVQKMIKIDDKYYLSDKATTYKSHYNNAEKNLKFFSEYSIKSDNSMDSKLDEQFLINFLQNSCPQVKAKTSTRFVDLLSFSEQQKPEHEFLYFYEQHFMFCSCFLLSENPYARSLFLNKHVEMTTPYFTNDEEMTGLEFESGYTSEGLMHCAMPLTRIAIAKVYNEIANVSSHSEVMISDTVSYWISLNQKAEKVVKTVLTYPKSKEFTKDSEYYFMNIGKASNEKMFTIYQEAFSLDVMQIKTFVNSTYLERYSDIISATGLWFDSGLQTSFVQNDMEMIEFQLLNGLR